MGAVQSGLAVSRLKAADSYRCDHGSLLLFGLDGRIFKLLDPHARLAKRFELGEGFQSVLIA